MLSDLNSIVELAVARHASDIHIKSGLPVKFRIDGAIVSVTDEKVSAQLCEQYSRYLLGEKFERVASIGEADIGFTFPCGVRIRANVYRQNRELSIALRIFSDTAQLHPPAVHTQQMELRQLHPGGVRG